MGDESVKFMVMSGHSQPAILWAGPGQMISVALLFRWSVLPIPYHWVVEIGRTLFTSRCYLLDELTTVDQQLPSHSMLPANVTGKLCEMECHPFPESSKSSKSSKSSSRKLHRGSFWRGLEPVTAVRRPDAPASSPVRFSARSAVRSHPSGLPENCCEWLLW